MKRLLLLHGLAINRSREKLTEIKRGFDESNVVVFEEGSDLQTITASLMTSSLLAEEQLIILENPLEDFTNYQLPTTNYQLVLWFDHEVSDKKPIMNWIRKQQGEIIYFSENKEVSVFPFLDRLVNSDSRAFLELDKLKKGGFEIQYFIIMVFYLLRSLVTTPKNTPQFVKDKLKRQREKFNLDDIKNLYEEILEIDFKVKKGLMEIQQAEFMLVSKFVK